MPLRVPIDSLLLYFCPALAYQAPRRISLPTLRGKLAPQSTQCQYNTKASHDGPRILKTHTPPPKPREELPSSLALASAEQGYLGKLTYLRHVRRDLKIRSFTPQEAYDLLYNASEQGDFLKVEALIRVLVEQHGEKPNRRLYRAWILANTDPTYGSADAISRLLEEMAKEGIVPDSEMYHAMLKVKFYRSYQDICD